MILLIDNYDSFTFNLYQLMSSLGAHCKVVRNDQISLAEIAELNPKKIVLSPGPGHPTSAGITLSVIEEFADKIPILGVCLGHQAIGHAFGGKVVRARRPLHGKQSEIFHDGRGVFAGLDTPFLATRYHSLVVERESLPACLQITSQTKDGLIMGLRHRTLPIEGVQFHPESVATLSGRPILQSFLAA